ncbi:MAG TPA: hypothetical protein VH061_04500 [Solirubrobacteraceae bacterium]|nr:hypothetical protein [Solirubrobacteraceae bacterium]
MSLCVLPAGADASSTLLSGYGGPGEGNQAIIGSTLIGGGGKGGSGSGTGGSSQVLAGSNSIEASAPSASGSGSPHAKGGSRTRKGSGSSGGHASGAGLPAYTPSAATTHDDGGSTLGLTGGDLLYVVLALGVLALTAVLTMRLTRGPGGPSEAQ